MGTLPSGYKNNIILKIDCEYFELSITGNNEDKKSENLKYNQNVIAELIISGQYEEKVSVKSCGSDGKLIDSKDGIMLPSFYENGEYQIVLINKNEDDFKVFHMDSDLSSNMQNFNNFKVGIIKFDSDIGYSTFSIVKNETSILSFTIEVFPSKIDYKTDYQEIIKEINNEISSLAFEILGKTYLNSVLKDTNNQTNAEYVNILKFIFDSLEKDIKRICRHFKHNIQTIESVKNIEKSKIVSRKTVDYIRKHPNTLIESREGFITFKDRYTEGAEAKSYFPTKVIDKRKITTIDIFENRFVKYIITTIIKRLSNIEKNISKVRKNESPYLEFIKEKRVVLERYIKLYFKDISDLTGAKSMSLVFQMSSGYKELYKKYTMLKKGLALGEDLFKITPKKIYKLYEIWCYIKIHHLLRELGYEVKEHGILKYRDNGLYLSLLQEEQAKTVYQKESKELVLWYNKSYSSLPTTNQRPDTVLCIKNVGDMEERIYIFDAKYRINTESGPIGPMEEDINIMHRYRDSIVSKLDNGYQFKYDTFGAYVMFPYYDEKAFVNHRFYKSIKEVNIGALPMLPGSTTLMKGLLKKIIGESKLEAQNDRILLDDLDYNLKFRDRNVMVVNVKDIRHFTIYKQNNFYHIPKKQLNKVRLGVKYLSFYQSINAFGDDAGIEYYAEIDEVIEYRRGECTEFKSSSRKDNEIYLRFNLGDFIKIRKVEPIQSARLISYTTLYLLQNASNMHELNVKSSFEVRVYKKLHELAEEMGVKVKKELGNYYFDGNLIEIMDGDKIRVNGKFADLKEIRYLLRKFILI